MWSTCQEGLSPLSLAIYLRAGCLAWPGSGSEGSFLMLFLMMVAVYVCKPTLGGYLNFHELSAPVFRCLHICSGIKNTSVPAFTCWAWSAHWLCFSSSVLGPLWWAFVWGTKNLKETELILLKCLISIGGFFFYVTVMLAREAPVNGSLLTIVSESGRWSVFHMPLYYYYFSAVPMAWGIESMPQQWLEPQICKRNEGTGQTATHKLRDTSR